VISIANNALGRYQTSEILLVHNNIDSFINNTSIFSSATSMMSFTSTVVAGWVNLYATGVDANNIVKVQRTYIRN
jgi:hypothetical protein